MPKAYILTKANSSLAEIVLSSKALADKFGIPKKEVKLRVKKGRSYFITEMNSKLIVFEYRGYLIQKVERSKYNAIFFNSPLNPY